MQPTTEVRWWWRGSSPREVARWFAGLRDAVRDEARVDHYLVLVNAADTGIKARAGQRLDIKALTERAAEVTVVAGVVGTVEQWVKWSFPLASDGPSTTDLGQPPWIRTSKSRWLIDTEGAELELAEVDVGHRRWWSLAVEAEGADDAGWHRVVAALRRLAAAGLPEGLELTDDRSYGYAEMLARLHRPPV